MVVSVLQGGRKHSRSAVPISLAVRSDVSEAQMDLGRCLMQVLVW